MVSPRAIAAVKLHVWHKAYPMTGSASTFVLLIKLPGAGWKLISHDIAP
jgi:hypothetical protein